jgi:pimeloyl-ACP methyl ester carboxylesterase
MHQLINGINLAFDDRGSGPAVVLIHGFPLNRQIWAPQLEALQDRYRVIALDLRGFGESAAPEGTYTMDLFADDTIALLDRLGIREAVFCGMSMGGYVLFNLLERYPERVRAACFMVTRSGADDAAGKERRQLLAREAVSLGSRVVADAFAQILFAPATTATRPELVAQVCRWMTDIRATGLAGGLLAMKDRPDYTQRLGYFHCPCLVIGAAEDRAIPLAESRSLAAGLPAATLAVIPEAGHLASLENPRAVNKVLLDFLDALP